MEIGDIRLGQKLLTATNTLAYYVTELITTEIFLTRVPELWGYSYRVIDIQSSTVVGFI